MQINFHAPPSQSIALTDFIRFKEDETTYFTKVFSDYFNGDIIFGIIEMNTSEVVVRGYASLEGLMDCIHQNYYDVQVIKSDQVKIDVYLAGTN